MKTTNGSGAMFDGIAKRYDLLNALTSMGFDKIWRKKAIAELRLEPGQTLLDLAAGTLDISISALKATPSIKVIAADPSREMLKVGRRKLAETHPIQLIVANGESLPLCTESVHAAIIAFGIRNFSNRQLALQQLSKTMVPLGRLAILELSIPSGGVLAAMTAFYIRTVIPLLGTLLSSAAEYSYLPESMKKFPEPQVFAGELQSAGFEVLRVQPFMSGACHLYVCERQEEKTVI